MQTGAWSIRAGWAWHDEWVWGLITTFAFVGLLYIVAGPFRISISFPVVIVEADEEDACTASQVSTLA